MDTSEVSPDGNRSLLHCQQEAHQLLNQHLGALEDPELEAEQVAWHQEQAETWHLFAQLVDAQLAEILSAPDNQRLIK